MLSYMDLVINFVSEKWFSKSGQGKKKNLKITFKMQLWNIIRGHNISFSENVS